MYHKSGIAYRYEADAAHRVPSPDVPGRGGRVTRNTGYGGRRALRVQHQARRRSPPLACCKSNKRETHMYAPRVHTTMHGASLAPLSPPQAGGVASGDPRACCASARALARLPFLT